MIQSLLFDPIKACPSLASCPCLGCQLMMDSDSGGLKVEMDLAPQSHVCRLCWKPRAPHVHLQFHAVALQTDLLRMICFLQGELGTPSWLEGSVHSHFSTSGPVCHTCEPSRIWMSHPPVVGLSCHSADVGYFCRLGKFCQTIQIRSIVPHSLTASLSPACICSRCACSHHLSSGPHC